jgi:erythromycin esterase-like protein
MAPDAVLLDVLRPRLLPFGEHLPGELMDAIGSARLALLGGASTGTHEFQALRAAITRELIGRRGCRAVVIEGDAPDAWRVNRWVRGLDGGEALEALAGFKRFPGWRWRNPVMLGFIQWLREVNAGRPPRERAGFYAMDLYGLSGPAHETLAWLERVDPDAARRARLRYACLDHYQQNLEAYGCAAGFGISREDGVVAQLTTALQRRPAPGVDDPDALFHARQTDRLAGQAEPYYRDMFRGRASCWNQRELHMVDTLQVLGEHLGQARGEPARLAVWGHTAHLGDASATAMAREGEWSVGELARRRWPGETFLLGFTTSEGSVRAAADWDAPGRAMALSPALEGSWEALFHATGEDRFTLLPDAALRAQVDRPLLERAIGAVYLPEAERRSHYLAARLFSQFDAVLHVDRTRALDALAPTGTAAGLEAPQIDPAASRRAREPTA